MNLLYLKKFNNYYNKKVKYYNTIEDYIALSEDYAFNSGVDFNPGDGITTVKTANLGSVSFSPDYLLVLNENDSKNIVSRWFVLEMKRERNGQYSITLKRDLIADYFEELKTSPMFIYKGNLPASSPLIYNKENMTVNQIKTDEIALKDFTDTSWIVGYIANDSFSQEITYEVVDKGDLNNVPAIESLGIILNDNELPEQGGYIHQIPKVEFKFSYRKADLFNSKAGVSCEYDFSKNVFYNFAEASNNTLESMTQGPENVSIALAAYLKALNNRKTSIANGLDAYFDTKGVELVDNEEYNEIFALNGKIVRSNHTGLYYQLTISDKKEINNYDNLLKSTAPSEVSLYQAVMNAISEAANELGAYYQYVPENGVKLAYTETKIIITLAPLADEGTAKVVLNAGHKLLEDSPYSMFCLRNTPINLTLAVSMAEKLSTKCYDLQLLPYCPVSNKVEKDHEMILPTTAAEKNVDYFEILNGKDEVIDYLYFATSSQGSFVIDKQIEISLDPVEVKVANDCDTYRLCSPNYNGVFEFNAAKNKGVDYFEVSYTYKPYAPYIHVNPNFKNLYGSDFNDARGLICGGDFSLPRTSAAWENYQLQNKNYLNVFDRQIETMDANHLAAMVTGGISATAGAFGSGMAIGSLTGNVGVGVGTGIASALGGAADLMTQNFAYTRNRQLTIDTFNMNLQNIKALPTSLTKVGAYNIDNKIFPFLEYYTCTEAEKKAYRNKIKYEAMTVNTIGTMTDYIDAVNEYNFFKATPIVLEEIADDYHVATAIAQELEKGVYL